MPEKAQIERSLRPPQIIVKRLIANDGQRCLQTRARPFDSAPGYWQFHGLAFTFEPVSRPPWRKARQRISFEMARERMVATLRAELNRFIRERRNTRHIKKISLSETVFVIRFGAIEAIQAKVTGERGEPLRREAEHLFSAIFDKGAVDKQFRRAYKTGMAQLAAMRARRRTKSDVQ